MLTITDKTKIANDTRIVLKHILVCNQKDYNKYFAITIFMVTQIRKHIPACSNISIIPWGKHGIYLKFDNFLFEIDIMINIFDRKGKDEEIIFEIVDISKNQQTTFCGKAKKINKVLAIIVDYYKTMVRS